jgi:hypothetical protein
MIKKQVKSILLPILKKIDLYALYSLRYGYLNQQGWLKSFQSGQPTDRLGNPIPWMTYPFLEFLEPRIQKPMVIFEYGSGNSTLWWAKHVAWVISCEHDLQWYSTLKPKLPNNVELHHIHLVRGETYCQKIAEYDNKFDMIVIDGRDRVNCAINSMQALKEEGVIIWDNSDRDIYQAGYQFLAEQNFKRLDFRGMGPINPEAWCTSVFYRTKNCLDL